MVSASTARRHQQAQEEWSDIAAEIREIQSTRGFEFGSSGEVEHGHVLDLWLQAKESSPEECLPSFGATIDLRTMRLTSIWVHADDSNRKLKGPHVDKLYQEIALDMGAEFKLPPLPR
jgi:hypothetical protein